MLIRTGSVTTSLFAFLLAAVVLNAAEPAPPPRLVTAAELVRRLAHADERERADAAHQLLLFESEPPELLRAIESDDRELREQATKIVTKLRRRTADRVMRHAERFSRDGRLDALVANSADWTLPVGEVRLWLPAYDLGRRITEKADARWPLTSGKRTDLESYLSEHDPELLRLASPLREPPAVGKNKLGVCRQVAVIAPRVTTTKAISSAFIVSRATVRADKGINSSVLFANGDVQSGDSLSKSVIVCDGDITATAWSSRRSVLIARGNIKLRSANECTLIAGGTVTFTSQNAPLNPNLRNVVKESEPNPLGFITFFELKHLGVEAMDKDKAVCITKLTDDSPLRKAGVVVGDVVSKVNGLSVLTAEELRRALRDGVATKGEGTLTVLRDGKATDIRVPLPD